MELLISKNIARLRRERNITQDELASALDVTPQAVSNWERGGYPDITLLPGLANYFGVSIDELMGNDELGQENDKKEYRRKYLELDSPAERYRHAMTYHRKYPSDPSIMNDAVLNCRDMIADEPELRTQYLPAVRELCEKMMDKPLFREYALRYMTALCDENELEFWLKQAAVSSHYTRRGNLIGRYLTLRDDANADIQRSLRNLENFSVFLDTRCSDTLGPVKKAEYHRNMLAQMDVLRTDGKLPDGWLILYGYKSLVLAACLFGAEQPEDGWTAFENGMAMMKTWFAFPDDAVLGLGGGELFGGLRIRKNWHHAVDPSGRAHRLFDTITLFFYTPERLHDFLTDPRWAWFDSVRSDPRFVRAVEWAGSPDDLQN